MSKVFIDTNILIYSMDKHDPKKQKQCQKLVRELAGTNNGVISTQVLQEFFVTATKKLKADPILIKNIMRTFENFEIVITDPPLIQKAIDCNVINKLSFWDSLIIVSAESAKCTKLWTEDLQDGQTIHGVEIVNVLQR